MKRKLLFVLLLMLSASSWVMAQEVNFTILISSFSTMLTTECGGTTPLPDGTVGYIYNAETDLPLEVGPVGSAYPHYNINSFTMNGGAFGMEGFFFVENALQNTHGCYAAQMPESFYLVVEGPCINGWIIHWISAPFSVSACGVQIEVEVAEWNCIAYSECGPLCVPSEPTFFPECWNSAIEPYECVHLCPGFDHLVTIGPHTTPVTINRLPRLEITPGCDFTGYCDNEPDCQWAEGWEYNPESWVWSEYGGQYYVQNFIHMPLTANAGCVCLILTPWGFGSCWWLPVELVGFDAVAELNGIHLKFSTASESDNDRFEIMRAGDASEEFAKIATLLSHGNSPTAQHYNYLDTDVIPGQTYRYYLIDVDINGTRTEHPDLIATATALDPNAIPKTYSLTAYPNPFNPSTSLSFNLPEAEHVQISVFDVTGRWIRTLINEERGIGTHVVNFDARDLPSGVYFARMDAGAYHATHKLMLMR